MECEREGYYGLSHNTILTPFFAGSTSFLSDHSGKMEKLYIAASFYICFLHLLRTTIWVIHVYWYMLYGHLIV